MRGCINWVLMNEQAREKGAEGNQLWRKEMQDEKECQAHSRDQTEGFVAKAENADKNARDETQKISWGHDRKLPRNLNLIHLAMGSF